MTEYIPYAEIASRLPIRKGEILYVASDILELAKAARKHGERFDCATFIRSLQDAVGEDGTLLFPVFSWDFCKGIAFDYYKTKGKTGALGNTALTMAGFKRTKHPLYSFAVWGKDREYLFEKDFKASFGEESVFAYLRKCSAKYLSIGILPLYGNTFVHFVEQSVGVSFRYTKDFTADYVDWDGIRSPKTYSMYVRDLDVNAQWDALNIERVLSELRIATHITMNNVRFDSMDLVGVYDLCRLDILYNQARNIYRY